MTTPPPVALAVLCAVMREPGVRSMDTLHPGCHFFDVDGATATWGGSNVALPCERYDGVCYTQKLVVLMEKMLETAHEVFYYVEADHALCVPLATIELVAGRYMAARAHPLLITTGIGASGWLFNREWARSWVLSAKACVKWCACPDCIAALLPTAGRATTRVVLTQHVAAPAVKSGLSSNNKRLPRCMEVRRHSGLNGFDFFDAAKCPGRDLSPCGNDEWGVFAGH